MKGHAVMTRKLVNSERNMWVVKKRINSGKAKKPLGLFRDPECFMKINEADGFFLRRYTESEVIVFLDFHSQIYIRGSVDVKCLFGELSVMGYKFKLNELKRVHALDSEGSVGFTAAPSKRDPNTYELDRLKIEECLRTEIRAKRIKYDAIFILKNCYSELRQWDLSLRERGFKLFRSLKDRHSEEEFTLNCEFGVTSSSDLGYKMIINEEWQKVGDKLLSQGGRLVICGEKGAGKSTCVKWMVNHLLERYPQVLVVDVDPGQSEFTLPGCISVTIVKEPLLGPNYTHLQKPVRCVYIGQLDASFAAESISSGIESLVSYCTSRSEISQLPWIINTMGFVFGIGLEILNDIISKVEATNVLLISTKKGGLSKENFMSQTDYDLHVIESVAKSAQSGGSGRIYTSQAKRELVSLSYFMLHHQMLNGRNWLPQLINLKKVSFHPVQSFSLEPLTILVLGRLEVPGGFIVAGFGIVHAVNMENLFVKTALSKEDLLQITHIFKHCHQLNDSSAIIVDDRWSGLIPQVSCLKKRKVF